MNRRQFLLGIAGTAVVTAGCNGGRNVGSPWGSTTKKKVLVSFPGLYSFAAAVAGDDAVVKSLCTTQGVHFHGDVSNNEIGLTRGADVFVINGIGADDYIADKFKGTVGKAWNVLDLGKGIPKDWLKEGECKHEHHHEGEHEHPLDPHVWLSPKHAGKMVELIRDELKKMDPEHSGGYDARAAEYVKRLEKLGTEGKSLLQNKTERNLLTFHDSLGYFAEFFGLKIAEVIEVKEGVEPDQKKLKDIIRVAKGQNARLIAVEPQFPRNTSALAIRNALRGDMVESDFVEVDTLETAEERELSADWYETKIRRNLDNLAAALK